MAALAGGLAWLALALLVGASGWLAAVGPPFPQLILVTLTALLLLLARVSGTVRAWTRSADVRLLVLIHLTRFVGFYFLLLYRRGELPWAFAVPGGWGDIAIAAAALTVVALAPRRGPVGWWSYFLWNAAGLIDIVLVVVTAARLGLAAPTSMRALTVLPLSLLPTFLVPIIIASHVVIFARLARSRRERYRTI